MSVPEPTLTMLLIAALVLLFVLAAVVAVFVLRRRKRAAAAAPAEQDAGSNPAMASLDAGAAIRALAERLGRLAAGSKSVYAAPWTMVLGATDAGTTSLIRGAGLEPLFEGEGPVVAPGACTLHLTTRGVLIDVDGRLVEAAAGDASWNALMAALQTRRHLRPLDSVVVVLSCRDLLAAVEDPAPLLRQADALRARLEDLQRKTGLCLPLSCVVSHADALTGFRAFWSSHSRAHAQILGWTSEEPRLRYSKGLVDEAVGAIEEALWREYVERARDDAPDVATAQDRFAFLSQVGALSAPLGLALDRLFRGNAFEETHALRGIYLAGTLSGQSVPSFVGDLFAKRILAEAGLARVARQGLVGRTQAIRGLQAAAAALVLVMAAGLWWGGRDTSLLADRVIAALHVAVSPEGGGQGREDRARKFLSSLSAIHRDSFFHLALPTSWLSSIDAAVIRTLAEAMEPTLLEPIRRNFVQRYRALGEKGSTSAIASGDQALASAIVLSERLSELHVKTDEFNDLHNVTVVTLANLASTALDTRLDAGFTRKGRLYTEAARQADTRRLDFNKLEQPALALHGHFVDDVLTGLGPGNRESAALETLARIVRDPAHAMRSDVEASSETGRALAQALVEAGQTLDRRVVTLAALPDVNADVEIAAWLARLDRAQRGMRETLRERLNSAGKGLRDRTLALTDATGRPVYRLAPGGGRIELTLMYAQLRDAVAPLMAREFMRRQDKSAAPTLMLDGSLLLWSRDGLERARRVLTEAAVARTNDLPLVPASYQPLFERLVGQQAEAAVIGMVREAQRFETPPLGLTVDAEASLASEIAAFRAAAPALAEIQAATKKAGLTRASEAVAADVRGHARRLLARLNVLGGRDGLYLPIAQFQGWDGLTSATAAGFHADDDASVAALLDASRARVAYIWGELARPLVEILAREDATDRAANGPEVERWRQTGAQLRLYEAKNPDNSIAALERLLRIDLPSLKAEDCAAKIAALPPGRGGDLFSERYETIRRAILERCRTLQTGTIVTDYSALAARFNDVLAGRFPFAASSTAEAEADIGAVADFLRDFEQVEPRLRAALAEQAKASRAFVPALQFVDRLAKVKVFLAPVLKDVPDAIDVVPTFRANRAREAGGNQIIDWGLEVGAQVLRRNATAEGGQPAPVAAPPAGWRPGLPVAISLRWAKDGPTRPMGEPAPGPLVEDLTARFSASGTWGLVRLLVRHRPPSGDFERGVDPAPNTLVFPVKVTTTRDDPAQQAAPAVRVFVQLALSAPGPDGGAKLRLATPDFPSSAPRIAPLARTATNKPGVTK